MSKDLVKTHIDKMALDAVQMKFYITVMRLIRDDS